MKLLPVSAIAMILALTLTSTAPARQRSKILWGENLTEAVKEAKKTGKPIVVFFRRETDTPLKEGKNGEVVESMAYEREVVSQRTFEYYAQKSICVKLFASKLKPETYEGQIASSLKIDRFPMFAVLEVSGDQVYARGLVSGNVNGRHKHYPVLNSFIAAYHKTEFSKNPKNFETPPPAAAAPPSSASESTSTKPELKPNSKRIPGGLATERDDL